MDLSQQRCGLLSAKGGLMMGTKKVGALPSPLRKANSFITKIFFDVKENLKRFLIFRVEFSLLFSKNNSKSRRRNHY
jgi:hypothetical protein